MASAKAPKALELDDRIIATAERLYGLSSPNDANGEIVARRCIRAAAQFHAALDRIRAEGGVELAAAPPKPEYVVVPRMLCTNDGRWTIKTDDDGEPIYDRQLADPHSYAPNLPDNHVINQRFRPADGIPASLRDCGDALTEARVEATRRAANKWHAEQAARREAAAEEIAKIEARLQAREKLQAQAAKLAKRQSPPIAGIVN